MEHFLLIGFTRQILAAFVIYIIYLALGSLIFASIESTQEQIDRNQLKHLSRSIIGALRDANFSDENIYDAFLMEHNSRTTVVDSTNVGWVQLYGAKVFFSFILITTIGYGNESAKTALGQIVCIIYTIIGIPLNAIMMRLLSFKFRGGLRMVFKLVQRIRPTNSPLLIFSGFIYFLFWTAIFLLIPAYIFALYEKWAYIKGLYFSFVTLSTIGLGDIIAGVTEDHYEDDFFSLNVVLLLIWTFFGLGFVAMALNLFSYALGVLLIDMLDSKCRRRATAKRQYQSLLDLIKEMNWQLVKYKPKGFKEWDEIEEFKNILTDDPQFVDEELLRKMFYIVIDLKEKAFDELSHLQTTEIPLTPVIEQARDDLPGVLSKETIAVSFGKSEATSSMKKYIPGTTYYGPISRSSLETVDPEGFPVMSVGRRLSDTPLKEEKGRSSVSGVISETKIAKLQKRIKDIVASSCAKIDEDASMSSSAKTDEDDVGKGTQDANQSQPIKTAKSDDVSKETQDADESQPIKAAKSDDVSKETQDTDQTQSAKAEGVEPEDSRNKTSTKEPKEKEKEAKK